jgi:hypothetical protein
VLSILLKLQWNCTQAKLKNKQEVQTQKIEK